MANPYKDIIKLKWPQKTVVKFDDDTYSGIIWNTLDPTPNPTQAELDAALTSLADTSNYIDSTGFLLNNENPTAQQAVGIGLKNSGVIAGIYPKVSVDIKGRTVAGFGLSPTDIPSLDWSKIATGKPTTINGYGITDAYTITPGSGQAIHSNFLPLPVMSGTSIIPFDSSIPLNSEGTLIGTTTCTPKSIQSKIGFKGAAVVDSSTNNRTICVAVFRNTICVYSTVVNVNTSGRVANLNIDFVDSPNTTSLVTYTIRCGSNASTTWYINQSEAGANNGGTLSSSITMTEYS